MLLLTTNCVRDYVDFEGRHLFQTGSERHYEDIWSDPKLVHHCGTVVPSLYVCLRGELADKLGLPKEVATSSAGF